MPADAWMDGLLAYPHIKRQHTPGERTTGRLAKRSTSRRNTRSRLATTTQTSYPRAGVHLFVGGLPKFHQIREYRSAVASHRAPRRAHQNHLRGSRAMVWPCPPSGGEDYAALVGTYTLPDEVAAGKPENEQTTIEITDTCPGLYLATFKKGGSCFSCTPLCCAGHNTWSNSTMACAWHMTGLPCVATIAA